MTSLEQQAAEAQALVANDIPPVGAAIPGLGSPRQPSFWAVLVHKLNVIRAAHGSWEAAAKVLGLNANVLRTWRAHTAVPGSKKQLLKIDSIYETSIDRLRLRSKGRFQPPTEN